MNAFRYIPALLVCILFFQPIVAQSGSEAGRLFIQNFSPKDYGGAHAQNWAVLQDQRGIMYFGNGVGVLEYDGVAWRLIPVSNQTIVRSLEVDENNRIYVGAVGDFGYLAPDSAGRLAFVSLLDKLPEANRDFSDVWQILHTREGIYFRTNNYLFRWELEHDGLRQTGADTDAPGTLRIWKAAVTFHHSFFVRDTLYIRQQDVGLMRMTGDSLQLLPGGELFADQDVRMLLPLGRPHSQFPPAGTGQAILVGTSSGQFFIFNGKIFHPFKIDPPAQQYLFANRLYHGAALPDHSLALATRRGGVVIIDREGKIQQIIDKTAGLRDQLVRFVYPDREGGLWLGLNNGLARVEYPAPFTFYNEASGITGFINSIVRFGDEVYAGGNAGIFRLLPAADHRTPAFQAVPGAGFRTWSLLALEEALLAAAANGIFRIEKNRVVKLADTDARSLYRSRYDRNLVFAGLNEGLAVLKQQGGQWRLAGQIAGISEEVRTIAEEGSGILWLGAMHQGFLRVIIPDFPALSGPRAPENLQNAGSGAKSGPELFATVQRYGPQQGLPTGTGRVFFVKGRVVFATDTGLKRFDPLKQQFLPDTSLGAVLADTSSAISHVVEGRQGGLWIKTTRDGRRETGRALPEPDGSYSWNSTAFERIADWGSVYAMYADPQHPGVLWLGGPEGIARYDHAVTKNYAVDFPALVRRVVTLKGDSLIYGGAAAPGMTSPPAPLQRGELENSPFEGGLRGMSTTLPYTHNALRFQFAASSFDDPTQNRYQVFLEGFDEDWSNWISETQKDYTNIPEGDYAFRVRAKNMYGHLSEEGRYQFTILPPWYRTWWAYMMYTALFAGVLIAIIRYRERVLRRRTLDLESAVAARTNDLQQEKKITEAQAAELKDLNNLKSRFFANISHEFRTPLTLILGQIDSVLPDLKKERNIQRLQMAHRNAVQLQRLINQLLDLSKFDAHQMKLHAAEQNIVPLLKQYAGSFETIAEQREISLRFEQNPDVIKVFIDRDMIEKVMYNLLSNALKFTPKGGTVRVKVECHDLSGQGEAAIIVRDSGIGIPAERLPHIFDRFFQVDSTATREFEGTGIGLALTKELVQLHGGGISVESAEGIGTTFTVRLPLGKAHLKPEQIADASISDRGMRIPELKDEKMPLEEITAPQAIQSETQNPHSEIRIPKSEKSAFRNPHSEIVLIVEDNPDMRAYIRDTLAGSCRILEAPHGEAGFALAQEHIPDLIITDVMMPKVDGYALTRMLRQDLATSHIPIIMLTAKAEDADKFEGLETGVDAYLTKPFSTQELQIRVRKMIERYRLLREQTGVKAIMTPAEVEVSSLDQQFLQRLQEVIEANIENHAFTVDELALQTGVNKRLLQRKVKALTDLSPIQCLRSMRLHRARQLLEKGAGNVTDVCFRVGYNDISAFSKAFSEAFGQPPSAFIARGK